MKDAISSAIVALRVIDRHNNSPVSANLYDILDSLWLLSRLGDLVADTSTNGDHEVDTPIGSEETEETPSDGADGAKQTEKSVTYEDEPSTADSTTTTQPSDYAANLPYRGAYSADSLTPVVNSMRFRGRGASPLDDRDGIQRSLRPLKRSEPSRVRFELDEHATASTSAESGFLLPQIRSVRERWIDLDVVIDVSPSMAVWHQTLRSLKLLFLRSGVFRRTRFWSWDTQANINESRIGTDWPLRGRLNRTPRTIPMPDGRQLILVVTDAIADGWHDHRAVSAINQWSRHASVALLPTLPSRMWKRTGLSNADPALILPTSPGTNSREMNCMPRRRSQLRRRGEDRKMRRMAIEEWRSNRPVLPVTSFRASALQRLSRLIAGAGTELTAGVCLGSEVAKKPREQETAEGHIEPLKLYQAFKAGASPAARQLARNLSALGYFSLEVVRLIRETMVEHASLHDESDVLFSGITQTLKSDDNPEKVIYGFPRPIRNALQAETTVHSTYDVLQNAFEFWSSEAGIEEMSLDLSISKTRDADMPESSADNVLATIARDILSNLIPVDVTTDSLRQDGGSDSPAEDWLPHPDLRVSIGHLPQPGKHFVGRENELNMLDEALKDPKLHIIEFVAFGGVGKSALTAQWIKRLQADGWRGAARIFGHSFYSQGSREDAQASADSFLNEALIFFGDPDPTAGSPWDKGERLARLVCKQPTLLILDGMEPLQYPANSGDAGKIRDPGLQALVRELAINNNGLVTISTRTAVLDLEGWEGVSVRRVDLEHLSPEAGAALLGALGVDGTNEERQAAAKQVKGHGLALTLLGNYLKKAYGGDIRQIEEVELFKADHRAGSHAQHLMARYERFLGEEPELSILRLLGLFDRPATKGESYALRAKPAIPGLTDKLVGLSEADWNIARSNLRDHGLLDPATDESTLDAHPLIREYFSEQLQRTEASEDSSFKEAHRRLYEHLRQSAPELPDNLNDMMPLFHAIRHGCLAGKYESALEVYWERVIRKDPSVLRRPIGAPNHHLSAISHFFEVRWHQPNKNLSEKSEAFVLHEAGHYLFVLGRLDEALKPMKQAIDCHLERGELANAGDDLRILREININLGRLTDAEKLARKTVKLTDSDGNWRRKYADIDSSGERRRSENEHSRDWFRMSTRASLAQVLHYMGNPIEAKRYFQEAEEVEKARTPKNPRLTYIWGFWYWDFLLDKAERVGRNAAAKIIEEVQERAQDGKDWVQQLDQKGLHRAFFDKATANLILGRASMLQEVSKATPDLSRAKKLLDDAVTDLRQTGQLHHIANGLLVRAAVHRVAGDLDQAEKDVSEAKRIALRARGPMKIHVIDTNIELAQLRLARSRPQEALPLIDEARKLIEETGYLRREHEIEELQDKLR